MMRLRRGSGSGASGAVFFVGEFDFAAMGDAAVATAFASRGTPDETVSYGYYALPSIRGSGGERGTIELWDGSPAPSQAWRRYNPDCILRFFAECSRAGAFPARGFGDRAPMAVDGHRYVVSDDSVVGVSECGRLLGPDGHPLIFTPGLSDRQLRERKRAACCDEMIPRWRAAAEVASASAAASAERACASGPATKTRLTA